MRSRHLHAAWTHGCTSGIPSAVIRILHTKGEVKIICLALGYRGLLMAPPHWYLWTSWQHETILDIYVPA